MEISHGQILAVPLKLSHELRRLTQCNACEPVPVSIEFGQNTGIGTKSLAIEE